MSFSFLSVQRHWQTLIVGSNCMRMHWQIQCSSWDVKGTAVKGTVDVAAQQASKLAGWQAVRMLGYYTTTVILL